MIMLCLSSLYLQMPASVDVLSSQNRLHVSSKLLLASHIGLVYSSLHLSRHRILASLQCQPSFLALTAEVCTVTSCFSMLTWAAVDCSVPLKSVEYQINGQWWSAARSVNNQWPYHRELGDFSFPLPIRVTSVAGEVLEDVVPSSSGQSKVWLPPASVRCTTCHDCIAKWHADCCLQH